jgi:carbonic anhydrase
MCGNCNQAGAADWAPLSRRGILTSMGAVAAGFMVARGVRAEDVPALPKPQNVVSPDEALELLLKGNARYIDGVS